MGCDITSFAEVKRNGIWEIINEPIFNLGSSYLNNSIAPFNWRNYGMFGFLADVRNYSKVPPIANPRGLPKDSQYLNSPTKFPNGNKILSKLEAFDLDYDSHSASYLYLQELIGFDYDKEFENRRYTETIGTVSNGTAVAKEGEGKMVTFREFLGENFLPI